MILRPNIFTLSDRIGQEDRFTSQWHYLLDCHPELAQAVADRLAVATGLPISALDACEDHPWFNRLDRPDFLIRTRAWALICEHKLDAGLGKQQLHRYAKLTVPDRRTALVLITNTTDFRISNDDVPKAGYLKPLHGAVPYFMWEDFFDLVAQVDTRLARDFASYMKSLGMNPVRLHEWGDPLSDPDDARKLGVVWDAIRGFVHNRFRPQQIRRAPRFLGLELRRPYPGIRHIYMVFARPSALHLDHPHDGRAMFIRVWSREKRKIERPLPNAHDELRGRWIAGSVRSPQRDGVVQSPAQNGVEREYAVPIDQILVDGELPTIERATDFVGAALDHLAKDAPVGGGE